MRALINIGTRPFFLGKECTCLDTAMTASYRVYRKTTQHPVIIASYTVYKKSHSNSCNACSFPSNTLLVLSCMHTNEPSLQLLFYFISYCFQLRPTSWLDTKAGAWTSSPAACPGFAQIFQRCLSGLSGTGKHHNSMVFQDNLNVLSLSRCNICTHTILTTL